MDPNKTRKRGPLKTKRCPVGTRKNKAGDCIPIKDDNLDLEGPIAKKRCPTGEHYNVTSKKCEPTSIQNKTKRIRLVATVKEPSLLIDEQEKPLNENTPIIPEEESVSSAEDVPITEPEINAFLKNQEYKEWLEDTDYDYLYPDLNDPNFAIKIAKHKEFNDTQYDGTIKDIQQEADRLCNIEFELNPHQLFVRNFLSLQTPYNSLLLYHGLGSGKTCSAIGIAEEMRTYVNNSGLRQKIYIIAAPTMQANFRNQLFDERKLVSKGGIWTNNTCNGNRLLKEINPTNLKHIPKEKIVSQINAIIHANYAFMGYVEFANYIHDKIAISENSGYTDAKRNELRIRNIQKFFDGRLIIIDEIHNIRITDDNKKGKRTAKYLMDLAKYTNHLRLLLLSATPMYNSYKEILWLANLMNLNDKRSTLSVDEIFERDGSFKEATENAEGGLEKLQRKLTGYVSYVRGENPYTFPFRIYPPIFDPSMQHSLFDAEFNPLTPYPTRQMNRGIIDTPLQYIHVYVNSIGEIQEKGYKQILDNIREQSNLSLDAMPNDETMESYGYMRLQPTLEALNIVYPNPEWLQNGLDNDSIGIGEYPITGSRGLHTIMNFEGSGTRKNLLCEYKPEVIEKYGRIFGPSHIGKYSSKIASICEQIRESKGIVLVFSQYIDGGVIPIALALEEMGFSRFGTTANTQSLFHTPPTTPLDAISMKPYTGGVFTPAQYILITGDNTISPNNPKDIAYVTHPNNKDGHLVKVIIISKAAAEGVDFKFIRQVHILEPWYNMNRMEQIIGRAVRNQSHCELPFAERNVQIFLHATRLTDPDEESADYYLYRFAEKKALKIGQVTRALKEVAVDCLLNISQTHFTAEQLATRAENKEVRIRLSNGKEIPFRIGDQPRTDICDYMGDCAFKCAVKRKGVTIDSIEPIYDTYHTTFATSNADAILSKIKALFKENVFYTQERLEAEINQVKNYPLEQIYSVLSGLLKPDGELLVDAYGRLGKLIRRGNIYAFQPMEITDEAATIYERSAPVDYKRGVLAMKIAPDFSLNVEPNDTIQEVADAAKEEVDFSKIYYDILQTMQENFDITKSPTPFSSKEINWYKHISHCVSYLEVVCGIPIIQIQKHILYHCIDTLSLEDRIVLLKRVNSAGTGIVFPPSPVEIKDAVFLEKHIYSYFEERRLSHMNGDIEKTAYLLATDKKYQIFMADIDGEWNAIEEDEWLPFTDELRRLFIVKPNDYANIVGFMYPFKTKDIIFKTKDMTNKRRNNKGAKCDSAGRENVQILLGKIGGDDYRRAVDQRVQIFGICGIVEILLRHFTDIRHKGKVWFLDMERALFNDIESVTI